MADIDNDVTCARDGCGHLASGHQDTDDGDNTGACTMDGCDCSAMQVPEGEGDGGGDGGGDGATSVVAPAEFTVPEGARVEIGDAEDPVRMFNAAGDLIFSLSTGWITPDGEELAVGDGGEPVPDGEAADGVPFTIPVGILEEVDTGDGRRIQADALSWRELPISLKAVTVTGYGHDGAELVGRVDSVERIDASGLTDPKTGQAYGDGVQALRATGVFTTQENADTITELIRGGFLRGISADLSDVTSIIEILDEDGEPIPDDEVGMDEILFGEWRETVTSGRVMAFTICDMPAFEGCYIELDDETRTPVGAEAAAATDGRRAASINVVDHFGARECGTCEDGQSLVASAGPLAPPRGWFEDPSFGELTPLTITEDGRVYGHLAAWDTCHTSYPGRCVTPPKSMTNYGYFRTGAVETAEGEVVSVGQITLDTGHAGETLGIQAALSHYDDTGTAVADVTAGEDRFGIWIAGAMRPDVTALQVRKLRAAGLSGDWRQLGSGMELVAALACNVQGFPIVRAATASGAVRSLVAAGARAVIAANVTDRDRLRELEAFKQRVEPFVLDMEADRLRRRVHS